MRPMSMLMVSTWLPTVWTYIKLNNALPLTVHQKIKVVRRAATKTNIRLFPFLTSRRRVSRDIPRNDKIVASQRQLQRAGSHSLSDNGHQGVETRLKGYGAMMNGSMETESAAFTSGTDGQPLLHTQSNH